MNAIHTIEDLMQVLDENPQWVEAMRSRLLTRDLIELPEKFAQLVEKVDSLVTTVNSLSEKVDILATTVNSLSEKVNRLEARQDRLEARQDKFEARQDKFEARQDRSEARLDRLETRLDSIQDDLGILKGAHARSAALRDASSIAREMGLRWTKTLAVDDLWAIIDRADTSGIPKNELQSFRHGDLIMEATDQDGQTCYIAAEVSFTTNGRDTTRALRNADFLTRFTAQRAFAVVVGLYRDDRIQAEIESGKVFWHRLDPEILAAE